MPLQLVELASGLDSPSYATTFPENEDLLVVAEKGTARITCISVDSSTPTDAHLVLDLASSLGAYQAAANDFLGLSGFAFHPWFDLGRPYRWLFVRYHVRIGGGPEFRTFVDAFPVSSGLPVANVAARVNVYTHVHPDCNTNVHYGSQIHFDPTSYDEEGNGMRLWIPMGDGLVGANTCLCGTSGLEQMLFSQNIDSDFGKLIMVEVDVIPTLSLSAPVIYGRGLRNPYSFSVDPWTGDLWIADVGSTNPQGGARPGEIHIFPGGPIGTGCPGSPAFGCQSVACFNFGWPMVEGVVGSSTNTESLCHPSFNLFGPCVPPPGMPPPFSCPTSSYVAPLLAVDNLSGNFGEALLGGLLYRGSLLTGHQGRYFYGHFSATEVISIDPANAVSTVAPFRVNHTNDLGMDVPASSPLFSQFDLRLISSTWAGEILLIQVESNGSAFLDNGKIYKVVPE